jgi:hypothetical protein
MGTVHEPAAYMPMNGSNVIECRDTSVLDNSVSTVVSIPINSPTDNGQRDADGTQPMVSPDDPPFYSPHFYWKCKVASGATAVPLTVDCMIDNGSQPVLIDDALASSLALKRRKLYKPHKI